MAVKLLPARSSRSELRETCTVPFAEAVRDALPFAMPASPETLALHCKPSETCIASAWLIASAFSRAARSSAVSWSMPVLSMTQRQPLPTPRRAGSRPRRRWSPTGRG